MPEGHSAAVGIADIIKRKLAEARDTLIERNLRNRLVNCALTSKRSRQIRVVDELPNEVFKALLTQKREFVFAAGRGVEEGESTKQGDMDFGEWVPPEDEKITNGVAQRHRDNALQTQLTPEGLQKRLTSLYYESREVEEEQGVNVLYLALGFLKWFENGRSEVSRFAPLILLPVELIREGAKERFKLKLRDEDLYTNVSLKIWLAEQHAIQLPDLPEGDDWLPSEYFARVKAAIEKAERWEVMDSEILLGFFSFNKFLLWRDLDPKNWPNKSSLVEHKVLRTLLAPREETPIPDPPVIPREARLDDVFKLSELVYVLNADSSQTSAIQSALAGRNLVIQGPPGTGKSQTITNIIAAAIAQGKTVLFVAEKLAALEVVFERLKSVGLGHLCFELHSRKASKQQVLGQLREAINSPTPPGVKGELGARLDEHVSRLWEHSDRIHRAHAPGGYTPFEVVGRICKLKDRAVALPDFNVLIVPTATGEELKALFARCKELEERLGLSGVPVKHPWRESERDPLSPLDQQRLQQSCERLSTQFQQLFGLLNSVWPLIRREELHSLPTVAFEVLGLVEQLFKLVATKPGEPIEVLCSPKWAAGTEEIESLLSVSQRLADLIGKLDGIFVSQAWSEDWGKVRLEIAGSGQSLFRFLRSSYRDAMRLFKGASKAMPRTHTARLEALDSLIEAIALKKRFEELCSTLRPQIGALADALPHSWPRLESLVRWLRVIKPIEQFFSVRNPRLLAWSGDANGIANRVRVAISEVAASFFEVVSFVGLRATRFDAGLKRISWNLGELDSRIAAWNLGIERFNEWPPVRDELHWLGSITDKGFAARCYAGVVKASEIEDRVHLAVFEQIWNAMIQSDPELSKSDGRVLSQTVSQFRDLDRTRIKASAHEAAKKHHDQKPAGSVGDMGVIRAELSKSRKHLPVRRLIESAGDAVQKLKPVFLMSPLSIAQYLAPGRLKFDLLLVDEASQVRPADALGAVARSGQVVVVGDQKQLPPTNFFNRIVADEDDVSGDSEGAEDVSAPLGSMESILSLCDATLSCREMLAWHYRSQHPALIAVSNRNFYEGKLLLPPSTVVGNSAEGLGVVFHKTRSGGYDRGRSATNVLEAETVADAVCRFAREQPQKTLGVGTFSVAQRDVIRNLIDSRRREAPELEPFFSTNRSNPFFVKNLESIQGDERDVIFISVGYGRDKDGRLTQSFGPINSPGGERRLNVLISRARERCEVFSPISGDDVDISSRKLGTVALREFLQYAEKGYFDVPQKATRTFDSDFEESVATFLEKHKYRVHPQVGMAGFYIDLGVIDSANSARYVLGIECDGATYHSSRSARDRDRIRQEILESRGWRIHRIWSTDWFHRRSQEEHRLLDVLSRNNLGNTKTQNPEPPSDSGIRKAFIEVAKPGENSQSGERDGKSVAYVEAAFRVRTSVAPHEVAISDLAVTLVKILEIESPIHEEEAARRVATVWGLERAGSRIREATKRALKALTFDGRAKRAGKFLTIASQQQVVVRDRSKTRSATLRQAEYLPPSEILAAAIQVLRESTRVHIDDLVTEVARRLGFLRTGPDIDDAVRGAAKQRIGHEFVTDADGHFKLVENNASPR